MGRSSFCNELVAYKCMHTIAKSPHWLHDAHVLLHLFMFDALCFQYVTHSCMNKWMDDWNRNVLVSRSSSILKRHMRCQCFSEKKKNQKSKIESFPFLMLLANVSMGFPYHGNHFMQSIEIEFLNFVLRVNCTLYNIICSYLYVLCFIPTLYPMRWEMRPNCLILCVCLFVWHHGT